MSSPKASKGTRAVPTTDGATLKYLRRLLKDEEGRLNRKRPDTKAGRIARAYYLGRVEAYRELIEFIGKQ